MAARKPLQEYAEKRSFDKTPEPAPGPVEPSSKGPAGLFFCVQRHDATRLHYDFRLEVDGVLASWAVPKGPSLEPLAKQLAIHVEDHPLSYGNFEGNIPKGEYGGGSVMLWDRGVYELLGEGPAHDQIQKGDLKFRLHGEKLRGEFALVHMRGRGPSGSNKGNEWLIIKKRDAEAQPGWNIEDHARSVLSGRTQQEIAEDLPPVKVEAAGASRKWPKGAVKAPMPARVEPMLATLAATPPPGDAWLYEVKWDGVRALCFIENKQLKILSRHGHRCDQQYPELSVLPHYLAAQDAIVDSEIAVLDDQGRPGFNLIQPRISVLDPNTISHLARKTPVTLFVFDLLYLDGHDLRGAPLIERKKLLAQVLKPAGQIRLSDYFAARGPEMLEAARQNGLEGIVAKRADSKYDGRRSRDWVKIKVVNQQEFVIAGFTLGERDYFSSLVLGAYEDGKLAHVGQVGTGFNDKSLPEIYKKLEPLITDKMPFAHKPKRMLRGVTWVKPELVCEVKYLEFTPDGQLRAPVFLGLRADKEAKDVTREVAEDPAPVKDPVPAKDEPDARPAPPKKFEFKNLDKIFFPKDGITKGDVIHYYDEVADFILPHLADRPLSLKRYPNGIHEDFFFQKDVKGKLPDWIRTEAIQESTGLLNYVICNDKPTLVYLANLGCIDHNPWLSRVGSLDNPDWVLIDLDPYECGFDKIVEAAQLVREALDAIELEGYPKTTGGDGMHVYIPLEPVYSYEQVRSFAEILWHLVVSKESGLFTTPRAVSKRQKGRVYFDWMQIGKSKTIAAPYVLRAHDGAPVSTPLKWSEVKAGLTPDQFNIKNALRRFHKTGDLFAPVLSNKQRLDGALQKLSKQLAAREG